MNTKYIYTVGYTLFQKGNNIEIEKMFQILKDYNIDFLVDVRSVPYSKQYPQCNAENLKLASRKFCIAYLNMPEIGAKVTPMQNVFSKASDVFFENIFPVHKSNRPEQIELQGNDEIVDFNKFRHDECFLNGLKRIENAYDKGYTLALMCSEKSPIDCHRYFLISKALEQRYGDWLEVKHIIQDQTKGLCTISNKELNSQLQKMILNKFRDITYRYFDGTVPIDNYYGVTLQDKFSDFCDRYWNIMHGWRRNTNINNNNKLEYYD